MTVQDNPGSWTATEVDPATTADSVLLGSAGPFQVDDADTANVDRPGWWHRSAPARLLGQTSVVIGAALLAGLTVFLIVRQLATSDSADELLRGGPVDTITIEPSPDQEESAPPNSSRSGSRRSEADGDSPSALPLGDGEDDRSTGSAGPQPDGNGNSGSSNSPVSPQDTSADEASSSSSTTTAGPAATGGITMLNASTATTGSIGPAGLSRITETTGRTIPTTGRTTSVTSATNSTSSGGPPPVVASPPSTTARRTTVSTAGPRATPTITSTTVSTNTVFTTAVSTTTVSTTTVSTTTVSTSAVLTNTDAPLPAELISLPADGSVHNWGAITRMRANRVPGATSYCWSVTAGRTASRCQADRDFDLAAGQLDPGPAIIEVEARAADGTVLMAQRMTISRLIGRLVDKPEDGASFEPNDKIELRAEDIGGADNYCWVLTQAAYSSGESCTSTGRLSLPPGHMIRRTLDDGTVTVQARAYRGGVLIARQTMTITIGE